MLEVGSDAKSALLEGEPDPKHLGRQVPVPKPPPSERPPPVRIDPHLDRGDVGLEPNRLGDRAGQRRRRVARDRRAEILVKDAPELDPGFEQERLTEGQLRRMERVRVPTGSVRAHVTASGLRRTVNGPMR